jgi:hypothetical protein
MLSTIFLLAVAQPSPLVAYSVEAWRKEPETRIEDAYKWLFHATLGGEHAVTDDQGPRMWMDREWASLGPATRPEAEVVNLRPDGKIIRVSLRHYKYGGGNKDMMLAMFMASARRFKGDRSTFVHEWINLGNYLKQHSVGHVTAEGWRRLDRAMKPLGYPAVHHSKEYERVVRPAYRVILREVWAG